ncbi:hypothetical protein [Lactobacillus xylocopicola]|uniref:Uncharacterized protein n=1 Tax=Lactobacillus xylocopicola TaxID=2976676 RepID=A0ABN6SPE9_9LACO|nr:hypothetical protein [Lactobacillus xylocopicola]BDR61251.1 hypothetical protein KIM322_15120 [Lactobacillus xylocopicola]
MKYQDYVELGLKDDGNLKVILKGSVEHSGAEKVGVIAVVFITPSVELAKQKLAELTAQKDAEDYYMVYSCPLDTDLPALGHYPSLEIAKALR